MADEPIRTGLSGVSHGIGVPLALVSVVRARAVVEVDPAGGVVGLDGGDLAGSSVGVGQVGRLPELVVAGRQADLAVLLAL